MDVLLKGQACVFFARIRIPLQHSEECVRTARTQSPGHTLLRHLRPRVVRGVYIRCGDWGEGAALATNNRAETVLSTEFLNSSAVISRSLSFSLLFLSVPLKGPPSSSSFNICRLSPSPTQRFSSLLLFYAHSIFRTLSPFHLLSSALFRNDV